MTLAQQMQEYRLRARLCLRPWLIRTRPILAALALVGVAWRLGFGVDAQSAAALRHLHEALVVGYFADALIGTLLLHARLSQGLRAHVVRHSLAATGLLFVLASHVPGLAALANAHHLREAIVGIVLTELVLSELHRLWFGGVAALELKPPTVMIASFALAIAIGTALLLSPRAFVQPDKAVLVEQLSPVDALFTATSATCVTGLVVVDTGSALTRYGHHVLLVLIQVGGLGIMTFFAFFSSALGQGMRLRDQVIVREALQADTLDALSRMLVFIVALTLVCELVGACALYFLLGGVQVHGVPLAGWERVYHAVFHSVSAFCNAGFALYSDSLGSFQNRFGLQGVICGLIVVGGLGFPVIYDLLAWGRAGLRRRFGRRRAPRRRLKVQTRLVLSVSFWLGLGGAVLIGFYEWTSPATAGYSSAAKISNAIFSSFTCRTAGFNVADTGALTAGSILVMVALMFAGGSPASTAGGIKTTTLGILFARLRGMIQGRTEIEVYERTLPRRTIAVAISVATIGVAVVLVVTLGLLWTDPQLSLEQALFEVVSALGTVGLSRGVTGALSDAGKLLLVGAMFAGRLGPLTLVLALASRRGASARFQYPQGRVTIG